MKQSGTVELSGELSDNDLVITILSKKILQCLRAAASEMYTPQFDPDASDNTIKGNIKKAEELRELRRRYEDVVTDIIR